jgi:hypothetical protein
MLCANASQQNVQLPLSRCFREPTDALRSALWDLTASSEHFGETYRLQAQDRTVRRGRDGRVVI